MKSFSKIGKLSSEIATHTKQSRFVGLDDDMKPVYDNTKALPTVELFGTVKLHGTNAGVAETEDGTLTFQSRVRVITPLSDNHGFAFFADTTAKQFKELFAFYRDKHNLSSSSLLTVFGEWAGIGMHPAVAVSKLPKSFYVFAVWVSTGGNAGYYLDMTTGAHYSNPENNMYNLWDTGMFPVYKAELDLNNPKLVQNDLIAYTDAVEEECPVAKALGVSGVGEGVVWVNRTSTFRVKIKGDKHAGRSKVRKTNIVDLQKLESVNTFVETYVTEERLNQGFNAMAELGYVNQTETTGDFIRWVIKDVLDEESDTMLTSSLEPKAVNPSVAKKAAKWYSDRLSQIG